MTDKPSRSIGRKSVQVSAKPQDLMAEKPVLARAWSAQIITLFPDAFPGLLGESLTGKALKDGIWQLHTTDLRRYGDGKHRNVDDTLQAAGAGMVLRADVVGNAIADTRRRASPRMPLIYLSPRGVPFTQSLAKQLSGADGVTLLCGRFEGVDERVLEHYEILEVSMGDYVLTGGELPAMTLIDACVRLLPGCWEMLKVLWKKAIPTACSNTPNTPAPLSGKAARSQKSSPQVITEKSPNGAAK